jgi:predicted Zn-dependent peptidase
MKQFKFTTKKLPKGLTAILLPRTEGETVTFLVLIGVGSRYETPRQAGLSHFLEHMFFKGTKTRPDKREIAEAMDNIGAEFNAFTSEEATGYYVKVAKEHLATGADVVSDILLRSLFPAEEIERERGVIIQEIRMYTDQPSSHVGHLWNEAMYGSHPLGRRIDGFEKTVSTFQRADFVKYTKQHYHTRNAVVAVAGNFNANSTTKLLQQLFAKLPAGQQTHPQKIVKLKPKKKFVMQVRASLDQTHLIAGVPGLSLGDPDRWAGEVLAVILGGGMSSRMFMSVREEHGLAYAIRTRMESHTDAGTLTTQAGLRSDKAAFALDLIIKEYDRMMTEPVPTHELNKAKQMLRGRLVLDLEETNSIAMYAASQQLLEHDLKTPQQVWQAINGVSPQDIQRIARRLLKPALRCVAVLGPKQSAKDFEKLLT